MNPTSSELDRKGEGCRGPTEGQAPLLVLLVVATLLVLVGFFIHGDFNEPGGTGRTGGVTAAGAGSDYESADGTATDEPSTALVATLVHPVRYPTRIVIPAIEVDAPVVSVGLLENGDMETPHSGHVGWYSLGPAPGEPGPAVMLAHVDTLRAPDVFYHLKDLRHGDEVLVYGMDDDPAVFVVDSVEQQLKIDLPRDRIWYYTSTALIRLITCGGEWDSDSRHYLSNVIVYGHLVR